MIKAEEIMRRLANREECAGVWQHLETLSEKQNGTAKLAVAHLVRLEFGGKLPTSVCFDPDAERDLWRMLTEVFMVGVALADAPKRQPGAPVTETHK